MAPIQFSRSAFRCGFWILFQTPDKKVFWEQK